MTARRRRKTEQRWRTVWKSGLVAYDMARAGLTQTELAEKAGVTQITVSRLLRSGQVGVSQVARIAKALGQPIERYVEDVVWEPQPSGVGAHQAESDNT